MFRVYLLFFACFDGVCSSASAFGCKHDQCVHPTKAAPVSSSLLALRSGQQTKSSIEIKSSSSSVPGEYEGKCKRVTTQQDFDLQKYISKPWYVQQQMVTEYLPLSWNYCLGAKYTMMEKSSFWGSSFWGYSIEVRNVAREKDGTVHDSGSLLCAYSADKNDPAKLGVAPCFLPTFLTGDYWVLAYDEEEGFAVISGGQPTYETENGCTTGEGTNDAGLWLFSRQQERNETLVAKMRGIATEQGFDLAVLNDVDNTACGEFPDSVWA